MNDVIKEQTEICNVSNKRELIKDLLFESSFPIRDSLRPELSWSHYKVLIRVSEENARTYYLNEAANQNWSYRTLDRYYSTKYYKRLLEELDG